ncbi:MAG: type II toxin-antitoxin system RelE/ParE family toxin [Fibrobacter sp.]|nr:type II toxin-antitoxin system RelE/ParE family toxin [Fibrobacter sp.]
MKVNRAYSLIITKSAKRDLHDIVSFIALSNKTTAKSILDKLRLKINNLSLFPEQGRITPELEKINIFIYRELIEAPWRIIYKIESNTLLIVAILDGRRNIDDLLLKRLLQ